MRTYFLLVCTILFLCYLFYTFYKRFKFNTQGKRSLKNHIKSILYFTILWLLINYCYYEAAPFLGGNPPFWHTSIVTLIAFGVVTIAAKAPYHKFVSSNSVSLKNGGYGKGWSFENFKKVKDISTFDITTYPRITIVESDEIIFDSSDFEIVNKTLKTFESTQPTFRAGYIFNLEGHLYMISNIEIDFFEVFLDYSEGYSKKYKGKPIPYNIQILIYVKPSPN